MDSRLAVAPVVMELAAAVEGLVAGLYVGGSLAAGDYQPEVSDIDAVALVDRTLNPTTRSTLIEKHQTLVRDSDGGNVIHCVYVPHEHVTDPTRQYWTWAFGEFFRRPFGGIARAELLFGPIVVTGPDPSSWLPPMGLAELRKAARDELAGYWTRALRKRSIWSQDVYVDIGLTVLARADATIQDGRLVTKSEAIARMPHLGVPRDISDGIAARRRGEHVTMTDAERQGRAVLVRELLKVEIARLLAGDSGSPRAGHSSKPAASLCRVPGPDLLEARAMGTRDRWQQLRSSVDPPGRTEAPAPISWPRVRGYGRLGL